MKFAFCIFRYFPYGGLERDFIRILDACQQRGHSIDVYTMKWQGEIPNKVKVISVLCSGYTNHSRAASFVKNLNHLLISKSYDAVVGFNRMPGLDVCYTADLCFAHNVKQNHSFFYKLTNRYKIYSKFEKAVFSPISKTQILYISPLVKKQAIEYYQTPEERFHLLPPGVAEDRIPPKNAEQIRQKIRKQHNINDKQKIILLIGSNFKLKGVDRAIKALAALPDSLKQNTKLLIVGKDEPGRFKKSVKKLDVESRVGFLGIQNDVPKLLLAADLLIHPARREAAGMAIMDAIVSGCPVLVTEVCGFSFHVTDAKAGLIVPEPFQQKTLNQLLEEMLTSDKQKQWQQNALKYAKTEDLYSRDKAVEVIEKMALSKS